VKAAAEIEQRAFYFEAKIWIAERSVRISFDKKKLTPTKKRETFDDFLVCVLLLYGTFCKKKKSNDTTTTKCIVLQF